MDFKTFGAGGSDVDPRDPIALYYSLDRDVSHVELRPSQKALLPVWNERRDERDVVVKLATGAGKTTIGLVILYSHMLVSKRPCLFLCPTNQLVGQVVDEARRCGVPAVDIAGGEHVPPECFAAQSVLITSVQNVFHARAAHFTKANFFAVLLDDAHSAVDIVRHQFRLTFERTDPTYTKLFGLFKEALRKQALGTFAEIDANLRSGGLEVPYWAWNDQRDAVATILTVAMKEDDALFRVKKPSTGVGLKWGLLKNVLSGTRCVFSNEHVEIAPEIPPIHNIPTFYKAERRIFMSATIYDESVLVRELGCSPVAARKPVELPDAGGIGERMILVPRLMVPTKADVTWEDMANLCKKFAKKYAVVVLTPSHRDARRWATVGARVVANSEEVPDAIADLRKSKGGFVAFANRYDGLDLPDDACRVLVIEGAPTALSLIDGVDVVSEGGTTTRRRAVMHRIEQGLGRAVRALSDYAVIMLLGNDLVSQVSRHETKNELTPQTRQQIDLGMEMAEFIKKNSNWQTELEATALQCLQRDQNWRRAYQQRMKSTPPASMSDEQRGKLIAQASVERAAWEKFINGQGASAAREIRAFLNSSGLARAQQAFLLQRAAWYIRSEEPDSSISMQRQAKVDDPQLMLPPEGASYNRRAQATATAAVRMIKWLDQFDHVNAAISFVETLRAKLTFSPDAPSGDFEDALQQLGAALGLDSSRPEKEASLGPDVLWMDGQLIAIIEAKNNTSPDTTFISKACAGQLNQHAAWAQQVYPERKRQVPVIAHPCRTVGSDAILPLGTRVLTPTLLSELLNSLNHLLLALREPAVTITTDEAGKKLAEFDLSLAAIVSKRTAAPVV